MLNNISKLKVVWICHFSNSEIQSYLPMVKSRPQFAPWISLLIKEFEKNKEIELHIIAPSEWLKKDTYFELNGVNYYFLRTGMPFIHRHWPLIFKIDYWTHFYATRRKIKKIVDTIKPGIINLHGIENPEYSTSIFDLKAYPLLITIQGLLSFAQLISNSYLNRVRLKTEQRIINNFDNYGIRVKFLADYLHTKNNNANFYWFKYPFKRSEINIDNHKTKTYDIVFFARLSKDKGIEDLIHAIQIAKNSYIQISVKIIGTTNKTYFAYLNKLVSDLGLQTNIEFLGFLPTQDELHDWVSKAKICVLPSYNDILPGTIIESIFLKLPVIAYAANGVVDFNFEDEIIRLVKIGDIKELANQITVLLSDSVLREKLSSVAYRYALQNFNNEIEAKKMVAAYRKVIFAFKN
jgi:glycosyltransferase involved in cell wall biosynthesis